MAANNPPRPGDPGNPPARMAVESEEVTNAASTVEVHFAGQQSEHEPLERGIYRRSSFMMVTTAGIGIFGCILHAVFYLLLRGKPANPINQEIYVRQVQNFSSISYC